MADPLEVTTHLHLLHASVLKAMSFYREHHGVFGANRIRDIPLDYYPQHLRDSYSELAKLTSGWLLALLEDHEIADLSEEESNG